MATGERIRWEKLSPIHRAIRRLLFDARILSALDIVVDDWVNQWEDTQGRFGIMFGVQASLPEAESTVPCDVMLTIACEAQGSRDEQERRALPLLLSVREAMVDSGKFDFVLAAGDRLYAPQECEPPQYRRAHLGFTVSDADLIREQREWEAR
ncbi:MAG: hypothetical protein KJO44_09955 [Gemmatimonadetes bacterium]|nr:hypothetical protein [Gemmatimonadota bacterium]